MKKMKRRMAVRLGQGNEQAEQRISRAVKILCKIHDIHLSKSIECTPPNVNPKINMDCG